MSDWKAVGVVAEGEPIEVGGVNPWSHSWTSLEQPAVELPHPSYPNQRYKMSVYEVESAGRKITFAAGEGYRQIFGAFMFQPNRAFENRRCAS